MKLQGYLLNGVKEKREGETEVTIRLFDDGDLKNVEKVIIENKGKIIISHAGRNKIINAIIPYSAIPIVAGLEDVASITCERFRKYFYNDRAQYTLQTDNNAPSRRVWDKGITGANAPMLSWCDQGARMTHNMFRDPSYPYSTFDTIPNHRKIYAYLNNAADWGPPWPDSVDFGDEEGHGSHTGCTIAGNDAPVGGASAYDGMSKDAKLIMVDCCGGDSHYLYILNDAENLYNKVYPLGAVGISNSWGSAPQSPTASDTVHIGNYLTFSRTADMFMWEHKDFLNFHSAGNNGASTITGANRCATEACNKNGITVGAVGAWRNPDNHRTLQSYSAKGTDDGRFKPDVLGIGYLYSAGYTGDASYVTSSGTSMACPSIAGTAGMVWEYIMRGWYPTGTQITGNGWKPSAALVKAILINSAMMDITNYTNGPTQQAGFGRPCLDSVFYFQGDASKLGIVDDSIGIVTGDIAEYRFNVGSNTSNLKVTLVWTDYPANENANPTLVNNLNLSVIDPSNNEYKGNYFSSGQSVTGGSYDALNNVEIVKINSPATGVWKVRVIAQNVPFGPQPYALVVRYSKTSATGVVFLDKPAYSRDDTVFVRVEDSSVTAPVTVKVFTKIMTDTETVTLSGSNWVYKGSIPIGWGSPGRNNGKIDVYDGDTIFAEYTDANPSGVSRTYAIVNANNYFTISNVHADSIGGYSANILWTTSRDADSKVYYGTNPSNLNLTASSPTLGLSHKVKLTGLSPGFLYYYDVESKDFRGNIVKDDNGGAHYTFTTGVGGGADILVIETKDNFQGQTGTPHPQFMKDAIVQGGWSYDWLITVDPSTQFTREMMKNYKAVVIWPSMGENYPPLTDAQIDTIKKYEEKGGRILFSGHDFGWSLADAGSPYYTAARASFYTNYCMGQYKVDLTTSGSFSLYGYTGDPISGGYASTPAPYNPYRDGAAGDSMAPVNNVTWSTGSVSGSGTGVWKWNSSNGGRVGVRWESTNPVGTSGDGVWGGYRTRVCNSAFEIMQIDTANNPSSTRVDFINKHLIWLIGHNHPTIDVTNPVGGSTYTGNTISIQWTASADAGNGASLDSVFLYYSPNSGQTWNLITKNTASSLTSPYTWDISSLTNGDKYKVMVRVKDKNVYPVLSAKDETGDFTINRTGGDLTGPHVVPGSITFSTNPVNQGSNFTLKATISDSGSGNSPIYAAEWSRGDTPANPGSGTPMSAQDGSFNSVVENVTATISTSGWAFGDHKIWVRGADNTAKAARWGSASYNVITVQNSILAIELSNFACYSTKNGVEIYWSSYVDYITSWDIERSLGNGNFEKIGEKNFAKDNNFIDKSVKAGIEYRYRLRAHLKDGKEKIYDPYVVFVLFTPIPETYGISYNKNIAGEKMIFEYQIPSKTFVSIKVYSITGSLVATLVSEEKEPGYYPLVWYGNGDDGKNICNGVYFVRMEAGSFKKTLKFILMK
uniref:Purple acid phosphatase N-terminal domain-containing protein n=1 Tax=candidate division WOR-3 bacterium TaxID=2052148 RepID=A0A7C4YG25_UNCW3